MPWPAEPTTPGPDPETGTTGRKRPARRRLAALAVALAVAGVALLAVFWAPLRRQVLLSTTRRPTPYTELYFDASASLPATVVPGGSYPVSFTVVNHQGRTTGYRAVATLRYDDMTVPLGTFGLRLGDGGRGTRSVSFSPPSAHTTYELTIDLGAGRTIRWRVPAP